MLLGHRRIGDEVLVGEDDAAIELFLAAIDPRQDEGRGQELEGAAQREELVDAMPDAATACRIERRHAQPSAVAALELGKLRCCIVCEGWKGQQRSSKETAARNRSRHVLSII